MDIAALSTISSQSQLMTNINISLLRKQLDSVQEAGSNMIKMMELSVQPHIGSNVDISL